MAKCEQCGAEFSNWFGDRKRLCPACEQQSQGEVLPPPSTAPPAPAMQLPPPIATRVLIGINVAIYVAMALSSREFATFDTPTVLRWGANFGVLTATGEWWRLLTSTFLHGNLLHIAVNMWALRNLGYTAELFYGRRNFLIIYFLSGLGGSIASIVWNPVRVSVGASGALFGVAGALAALVYFKKLPVDRALLRRDIGSVGAMILVNLLIGARVGVLDNSAHVGGLIAGTLLGFALPAAIFRSERQKSPTFGYLASLAVLAIIVVLALFSRARVAPDVEAYRAEAAYEAGNKSEAHAHAEKAAQLNPQSLYSNYVIGMSLMEQGQDARAIPFLERANRMAPGDREVQAALAEARQSSPQ